MTSEPFTYHERYQKPISYENVLTEQINRIAAYRSSRKWENYEDSIISLCYMLPQDIRQEVLQYRTNHNVIYIDTSTKGIELYDQLWLYINYLLEKNNLIFHTTYIKTYE